MENGPKARAVEDTPGLLQVVKHDEIDEIGGILMVTPRAADMIPEATLAVTFGLTVHDIIDAVHTFHSFSKVQAYLPYIPANTSTMGCEE